MSALCFDTLLTNLKSANDDEVPQWAIVLKECFKSILIALNDNNYSAENNSLKQDISKLKLMILRSVVEMIAWSFTGLVSSKTKTRMYLFAMY